LNYEILLHHAIKSIASVSKTRDDVAMLVELLIHRSSDDGDGEVGVFECSLDRCDSFRCG